MYYILNEEEYKNIKKEDGIHLTQEQAKKLVAVLENSITCKFDDEEMCKAVTGCNTYKEYRELYWDYLYDILDNIREQLGCSDEIPLNFKTLEPLE